MAEVATEAREAQRGNPVVFKKLGHADLVDACVKTLNTFGHYAWANRTRVVRYHGGLVQFGKKGSTDVFCCLRDGRMLFAEIKIGKDRLRPDQIVFRDEVTKRSHLWVEVRDSMAALWDLIEAEELY